MFLLYAIYVVFSLYALYVVFSLYARYVVFSLYALYVEFSLYALYVVLSLYALYAMFSLYALYVVHIMCCMHVSAWSSHSYKFSPSCVPNNATRCYAEAEWNIQCLNATTSYNSSCLQFIETISFQRKILGSRFKKPYFK